MKRKVLIVEDEEDVLDLVASNLKAAGFSVTCAGDGPSAIAKARADSPDLVLLDLMLPGISGLEVCKALRGDPQTRRIPILMLTAKAEEIDRIVGLELGADDYLTKPFSPRELVLRAKSLMRRLTGKDDDHDLIESGVIAVDRARHIVRVKGKPVDLTSTEFKLLEVLLERRGRLQSRERLLHDVWGYETAIDTRTVDTHVRRLREKLGPASGSIETVRGFGYRISEG